jgi:hypothetical protein
MDHDFLNAVKNLTTTVLDFLHASDGSDDRHINGMIDNTRSVLEQARKIPALKTWADRIIADDCRRHALNRFLVGEDED